MRGRCRAAKETLGAGSLAVRADVSNLTDLDTMFATIKREFGHLDGVFVNAGYSEFLLFEDVTEQSFDKVISRQFQRGLLHDSKGLAATQARLVCNHQLRPLARARGGRQPRPSRPARPRSSISLESSAPNSWTAGFA